MALKFGTKYKKYIWTWNVADINTNSQWIIVFGENVQPMQSMLSALGVIFLYEHDDKCVFTTTGSELDDGKEALKLLQYIISINLRIYKVYNIIFKDFAFLKKKKPPL